MDDSSEKQKKRFDEEGYIVVKGLLSPDEIQEMEHNFMSMHAGGPIEGCFKPVPAEEANGDALKLFPRMMHPHRVNEAAFRYMIHPEVMDVLSNLFGEEPLAAQSMFYFKPPGARGQALHQDNFYLKVEPGTCIAAWIAVDPADRENGGMVVVPKSNHSPIQCPRQADPHVSFTVDEVDVPEGFEVVPVDLEPGDVMFFNGSVIHGSYPNPSKDRFRRAFIGHYVGESTVKLGHFYNPMYTREGELVKREDNPDSGPCGKEIENYELSEPH
jgi:phytanoyl-CoA hydroxylase